MARHRGEVIEDLPYKKGHVVSIRITKQVPDTPINYKYRMLYFPHGIDYPTYSFNLEFTYGEENATGVDYCCIGAHSSDVGHMNFGEADLEMSYEDFKGKALTTMKEWAAL